MYEFILIGLAIIFYGIYLLHVFDTAHYMMTYGHHFPEKVKRLYNLWFILVSIPFRLLGSFLVLFFTMSLTETFEFLTFNFNN